MYKETPIKYNSCDKKYNKCINNEYNKLEQLNIKDKINIDDKCYYLYTRCYKYLFVDNDNNNNNNNNVNC